MRLDKLVAEMGDRIDLTWKSFLLRVEPKTGDHDKFVEYTKSWLNPAEQEPDAAFTVWSSDERQPPSSIPAHVAFKSVAEIAPDRAMDYHHALLTAYFTNNRNIGDSEVLLDIAAEIDIDRDLLAQTAIDRRDELTQLVIDEHNEALQTQINAVPTVLIEGAFAVPGAQPLDTYVRIVERIEENKASAVQD